MAAATAGWAAMRGEGALARWRALCETDPALARHLPGASARFAVEQDGLRFVVGFAEGRATYRRGRRGRHGVPAPVGTWAKFLERTPPRHHHNLFALRMRVPEFQATGDELAWAQHCHLVRRALDLWRWVLRGARPARRVHCFGQPRHAYAVPIGAGALRHRARRRPPLRALRRDLGRRPPDPRPAHRRRGRPPVPPADGGAPPRRSGLERHQLRHARPRPLARGRRARRPGRLPPTSTPSWCSASATPGGSGRSRSCSAPPCRARSRWRWRSARRSASPASSPARPRTTSPAAARPSPPTRASTPRCSRPNGWKG